MKYKVTNTLTKSILSAAGSSAAPSFDLQLFLFAKKPSKKSEIPAMAISPSAFSYCLSHKKSMMGITKIILSMQIAFGINDIRN
jgi:hypothetical protein